MPFTTEKGLVPKSSLPKVQSEIFQLGMSRRNQTETDEGDSTITEAAPKTARPSLYKVLLLNDDFTPMEFVIQVLKKFFSKSEPEAQKIMLQVHQEGAAVAGIYTFEVAETKLYLVNEFSRRNKHPLKCIMEKADPE
jgi:ATP-dependent Clp protease adaptor protein ClpS